MALPLVVLVGPSVIDKRWKRALWVLFNLLGAIVFGALHQSGVAPATAAGHTWAHLRPPPERGRERHIKSTAAQRVFEA